MADHAEGKWVTIVPVEAISKENYKIITIGLDSILIGHHEGKYFAVENICTHDGNGLEGAVMEGREIICPRHGAGFCLKTGKVTRPPAYEEIKTFPLRIVAGHIQIQLIS